MPYLQIDVRTVALCKFYNPLILKDLLALARTQAAGNLLILKEPVALV